ncbi:MAG: NAD(P)-dependent oxidoreductase, partial [Chitinophagaceae bacterium]|nr:NAD(P)-dependent oxidoreductase [Chitinophagaceae bacterium]
ISDLVTLADSYNILATDLSMLIELLNPATVALGRLRKITSKTFDQPSWELSMARKDARLMMEQAATVNKQLIVIPAVAEKMDMWLKKGYAKNDWTILSQDPNEY